MTAAGFVLLVMAYALLWLYADRLDEDQWQAKLLGLAIANGFLMLTMGIAAWLWRVMP